MNHAEVTALGLQTDALGNPLVEWCPTVPCRMEQPHYHSLITCEFCGGVVRDCGHFPALRALAHVRERRTP